MAARLATRGAQDTTLPARRRARQLLELEDVLTQVADMPAAAPSPAGRAVLHQARAAVTGMPRSARAAQAQGRALAELVRRGLDLGGDALGDLPQLFEQHFGVDVALSPLGTGVDGLCVHSGGSALLLASSSFPEGHLRFTLAHELGHHLLSDPRELIEEGEREMFADTHLERRVNAFAGHLLMPELGIRSMLGWLGEPAGHVGERAMVTLMEHFQVSLAALVYQLNILELLSFEAGRALRGRSVRALLAQHADAAPFGAATGVGLVHRSPERLTRCALAAARGQRLGLSVLASLLEVADDDRLWDMVMGPENGEAAASS